MCGIAGFTGFSQYAEAVHIMRKMLKHMAQRGPDGEGIEVCKNRSFNLCFGHRRLAIIDIDGGGQPMIDENNQLMVTYNGEIYNYPKLREQLIRNGYRFKTRCDTEVILNGFLHWGIDGLLNRIKGMFAFALFDSRKEALYLARDPFGQKPLFYATDKDKIAFASRISALHEISWISKEPDLDSLRVGVMLRHIPSPGSAYSQIKKVCPGQYIKYERGTFSDQLYYQLPVRQGAKGEPLSAGELFELIVETADECLISDVPVTLLLSSGLDSSLLACALAELGKTQEIESVTVGFQENSFDESQQASLLAGKLGLRHRVILLRQADVLEDIEEIFQLYDEPLGDPSLVATMYLCRAVSRITKVAIGGDGGDELFGGYPTFQAIALHRFLKGPVPAIIIRLLLSVLPVSKERYALHYKIERFNRGLGLSPENAFISWLFTGTTANLEKVLSVSIEPYRKQLVESIDKVAQESSISLMSRQYLKLFLPQVLTKIDCASMNYGLEIRAPFLQPSLSSAAFNLPDNQKINKFRTKYILRQIARQNTLREHARSPKQGFNVPLASWINNELRPFCEHQIGPKALLKTKFFNKDSVAYLWRMHLSGRQNNLDLLWSIIATQHFLMKN